MKTVTALLSEGGYFFVVVLFENVRYNKTAKNGANFSERGKFK
ncbi:hypothetical protein J2X61_004572 [Bacillus sp. 3255]|nr:hypothetical protein [Bacillus sp. 3255]